ncbi:nucleolar protein nop56, putative [Entamoeba invadens IP1]|uniref:Nucleolar protein 56 n=1 Tax=Entamoeba invadens IP1 TaxID=370355 RepID=A0A0A1U6T3_ENTIV|nr:nucleolar protein nop56, putative [Entamoeba invadens IP1]ELP90035.1 nucleolar protein nop56, putative [Entamoeba invadens IP1]|eukprot:XP_004256806.1 nucleolar protein nop56, putative [Entamoeba invadens IP1]
MADMVLYESPIGYALFRIKDFEQVAKTDVFEKSALDFPTFSQSVTLSAFVEFKTAEELLENINAISEGAVHPTLQLFLKQNVKGQKLGLLDEKLAGAIKESLDIECLKGKEIALVIRGIRTHFPKFLKDINDGDIRTAMMGLGHSYSRNKVKFNVNKQDTMAVQAIFMLDQLEKDMNTFTMRIKEWYSWHFPELYNILSHDNAMFVKCVLLIQNRHSLDAEKKKKLVEIAGEDLSERICTAADMSMGFDLNEFDLQNVNAFAKKVTELQEYKDKLQEYLHSKMTTIAPNLTELIGDSVGARLLTKAGSLTNLAKCPASTLQILGAEKALFRAIKTRANTPKYGVIFGASFIQKADPKNKGRISRYLANKASTCARIDCFSDINTNKFGEAMKDQVTERMDFLKTGKVPKTNIDTIKKVMEEVGMKHYVEEEEVVVEKGKKKSKKMESSSSESSSEDSD